MELNAWHHLSRVLAHEMMNSLSPVVSIAESLSAMVRRPGPPADPAEVAASLDLMVRRASHLMTFIERYRTMLDMPEAMPKCIGMADFAADLARITQAGSPDIALRIRIDPPNLTASIDRELMEQALINLLKNAAEAVANVPKPVIDLAISEADGMTLIEITDNGAGLPADPDSMFLPFYTTKPGGSGIGLAVARQIEHAHGGTLSAQSVEEGARFIVSLPNVHDRTQACATVSFRRQNLDAE